ncbi:MAG: hypothetical protein ACEY3D_02650 [Rickettsia sp.]|uniref:hypothetical protein n=1 Tax=Rickettsia sp. TaxID=789 RepID=UPI00397B4231
MKELIEFLEKRGLRWSKLKNSDTILYLSNNKIGAKEAELIANALKSNSTLTNLNLSYNQIGDEGT